MKDNIITVNKFITPATIKKGSTGYVINFDNYNATKYFTFDMIVTKVTKVKIYGAFTDNPYNVCFSFRKTKHYPLLATDFGSGELYQQYLVQDISDKASIIHINNTLINKLL
jgi:hypothetical protein